jgi:nitroreductase
MDLATVDELLTTTRTIRRRLDLDRELPRSVVEECLQLAVHAPNASNTQTWRFVVVTDPDVRAKAADLYRAAWRVYRARTNLRGARNRANVAAARRTLQSADHLAEHLHEVPVLIVPCILGRADGALRTNAEVAALYGSMFPAVWSLQLAMRSRGVGSALTTVHLLQEEAMSELLGIPQQVTQAGLLACAYLRGEPPGPASRTPAAEVTYWDRWG